MKIEMGKIYTTAILAILIIATFAAIRIFPVGASPNIGFSASISPTLVKNSTSYVFTITIENNGSAIGINKINITHPEDWQFNRLVDYSPRTWTISYDETNQNFTLTGPNILIGESAILKVNMTTQTLSDVNAEWKVEAYDTSGTSCGVFTLYVDVDGEPPTVTIDDPTVDYYSVGSGNRIWINVTVTDNFNITKYGMTVNTNDTDRFTLVKYYKVTDNEYKYCFANITAIPDGSLAVNVTATDGAGNSGWDVASTTIDNTAPVLNFWLFDQNNKTFKLKDNTYFLLYNSTSVIINATTSDAQLPENITIKIYVNNTLHTELASAVNETMLISGLEAGKAYFNVINNITVIDSSYPTNNTRVYGPFNLVRDIDKPDTPTWESYTVIKGGVLIKGLTATDNVAVDVLKVYNGTELFVEIPFDKLGSPTLWNDTDKKVFVFKDYVILNLTASVGKTLSIRVAAVDYAQNEGNNSTAISVFVEGYFYPLELKKGWNLISFPIIPETEAYDTIKTWFLAGNLRFVYGYDPALGFKLNPPMTHGTGYWVCVTDYDVLLVRGSTTELPLPPALPVSYDLKMGWNLVGYTSIYQRNVTEYLGSLEANSYYKYVYVWDATKQAWTMVDATNPANKLMPGTAFWIYMYKDQTLVPPVP